MRHHDPLFATALVLSDGDQRAQRRLVSCDLLDLDADTVADIRAARLRKDRHPAKPPSHSRARTHTTAREPTPTPDRRDDAGLPRQSVHTLVGVIEAAASDLQPAQLGIGWGESHIGINRREKLADGSIILGQNPDGPIDRAVGVLRIDALDGTPLACIVNFQTHPVSQTWQVDHISADYPGKMREVVEKLTGTHCLFLQGASGNINALRMEPSYEPARSLGVRLGCEVVRVWETVEPQPVTGLATA